MTLTLTADLVNSTDDLVNSTADLVNSTADRVLSTCGEDKSLVDCLLGNNTNVTLATHQILTACGFLYLC